MSGDSRATILVVEDSETIRSLMVAALIGEGHRVIEAWDLSSALDGADAAEADQQPIEVLVCDVILPGPSGFDVAARVTERIDRRVPTVFVTGGTASELEPLPTGAVLLPKPFKIDALRQAVAVSLGQV